jgi:hypothetical protein
MQITRTGIDTAAGPSDCDRVFFEPGEDHGDHVTDEEYAAAPDLQ